MKKRIFALALVIVLTLGLCVPASATAGTETVDITYRAIKIVLNGEEITPCDAAGKTVEPFIMNSNGTTYLPLRAIGQALGLGVAWDGKTNTVSLTSGGKVITGAGESGSTKGSASVDITYRDIKVVLDGELLELKNAAGAAVEPFIMDGTTYLPLRVVGEALGLEVGWDGATNSALLSGGENGGQWLLTVTQYSTVPYGNGYFTENYDDYSFNSLSTISYTPRGEVKEQKYIDSYGYSDSQEYSYDAAGNLIRERYVWGDGEYSSGYDLSYDSEGRILSDKYWDDYYGDSYEYSYTYSGNTRKGVHKDNFGGEDYEYTSTTWFSYDAKGNLVKEETAYSDGISCLTTYSYDAYGNLLSEIYTSSYGFSRSYLYTYDSNGNVLSYDYSDSDGDWVKEKTGYNSAGDILTFTHSESGGPDRSTKNTYDSAGRLSSSYSELIEYLEDYKTGDSYTLKHEETVRYTYDSKGNLISESREWKNTETYPLNTLTDSGKCNIKYSYEKGLLASMVRTDDICTVTESYTYDENGNLTFTMGREDYGADGGIDYRYIYEYSFIK